MQPAQRDDKVEVSIRKAMRNAVPGLTIFVVKPDGVRWARSFGLAEEALPFENDLFDAVLCCGSLHLFADTVIALREMARVMKPRGSGIQVKSR